MRKSARPPLQRWSLFGVAGYALIACATLPGKALAAEADVSCAPIPAAGRIDMVSSKRDAILGGMPSRLAQISAQQSGTLSTESVPAIGAEDCTQALLTLRPTAVVRALAADAPRTGLPDVFGSVAIAVSRTPLDASWRKVRAAHLGAGPWSAVLSAARAQDRAAQLATINSWVNARIAFVDDARRHGVADRWALPTESLSSGRGDCEDYAIAKLGLLRRLGISADDMFLVIARDLVRRADHAVLAVRLDDRLVILDNQTNRILDAADVQDYRPVMSYAGDNSWTHGYRVERPAPLRIASAGMAGGR